MHSTRCTKSNKRHVRLSRHAHNQNPPALPPRPWFARQHAKGIGHCWLPHCSLPSLLRGLSPHQPGCLPAPPQQQGVSVHASDQPPGAGPSMGPEPRTRPATSQHHSQHKRGWQFTQEMSYCAPLCCKGRSNITQPLSEKRCTCVHSIMISPQPPPSATSTTSLHCTAATRQTPGRTPLPPTPPMGGHTTHHQPRMYNVQRARDVATGDTLDAAANEGLS